MADRASIRSRILERYKMGGVKAADIPQEEVDAEVERTATKEDRKSAALLPQEERSQWKDMADRLAAQEPSPAALPNTDATPTSEPTAEAGESAGTLGEVGVAAARAMESPSERPVRDAYAQYEKYIRGINKAGADTAALDADLGAAREAYKEAKKTNEWKEVAQLIGQSLARFGAYAQGAQTGRLIGPNLDIPSIDYSKRGDQALDEYRTAISENAARRQEARATSADQYQKAMDEARAKREKIDTELSLYREKMRQSEEDRRSAKQEEAINRSEVSDLKKYGQQLMRDIKDEETAVARTEAALGTPGKGEKKLSLGVLEDRALSVGMTQDEIDSIKQKADDESWWDTDEKRAAALEQPIRALLAKKKAELAEAKKKADYMRKTGQEPAEADQTIPNKPTSTTTKKVVSREKLNAYMEQYGLTEEAARAALTSQGFTIE